MNSGRITMLNTNAFRLNGAQLDKTVQDNLASDSTDYIANTLNKALKNKLVVALNSRGYASVAELLENMPAVAIAASKDVSLKAFVADQLQGRIGLEPATLQAISDVEIQLSDTTTVGELLGLDTPLSRHAIFGDDAQRAVLGALQFTFQMDKLTQGNVPLVQAIQRSRKQQGVASARDLTKLSSDDWKKLITTPVNGQAVPVPSSVVGATRDEQ